MQNSNDSPLQQLSSIHFFPALASLWWVLRHSPQYDREYETGLFSRRPGTGRQQYSKRNSSFELRFDLKFSIIHPTNGLLKLLLKSNLQ